MGESSKLGTRRPWTWKGAPEQREGLREILKKISRGVSRLILRGSHAHPTRILRSILCTSRVHPTLILTHSYDIPAGRTHIPVQPPKLPT